MRGLYVHIPFCKQICSYCDFPKMVAKEAIQKEYVKHLLLELESYRSQCNDIDTVYIGGGTPNALPIEDLESILCALAPYTSKSVETTIEINSELFNEQQAILFSKYYINRVSIGVQTFQQPLITQIRRNHTLEDVVRTIHLLKLHHIDNINVDMMVGLPSQTMEDVQRDLDIIHTLDLKHLSFYSLILEEKTILMHQLKLHQITLPDDDEVADMLLKVSQNLKMSGFEQYEISNYAKKGYQSLHNLKYWNEEEYIGIGAGAAGFIDHKRYTNHVNLSQYYQNPISSYEIISEDETKREYMMLGLRKCQGISISDYKARFNSNPLNDFDLASLFANELLEEVDGFIRIPESKRLLSNIVFEEFVG